MPGKVGGGFQGGRGLGGKYSLILLSRPGLIGGGNQGGRGFGRKEELKS